MLLFFLILSPTERCLWSDLAVQTNAMAPNRPLVYIVLLFGTCFVWKFATPILWFFGLEATSFGPRFFFPAVEATHQ